ncbi:MAG: hypothetical protein J5I64_13160, partial [Saprospiraceae bacterium]|nr:hypothetical protein [Saprospiraceae bacterium]
AQDGSPPARAMARARVRRSPVSRPEAARRARLDFCFSVMAGVRSVHYPALNHSIREVIPYKITALWG